MMLLVKGEGISEQNVKTPHPSLSPFYYEKHVFCSIAIAMVKTSTSGLKTNSKKSSSAL